METEEKNDPETVQAEKLLGRAGFSEQSPQSSPTLDDLTKLQAPINPESGVINVLCTKHHSVFPITLDGKEELASRVGVGETFDWTGKYFQVSGCPFCTDDGMFVNPVISDFRPS